VIHSAPYATASTAGRVTQPLPASAYHRKWWFLVRRPSPSPLPPVDKIHPQLRQWMNTRPGTDIVELFVSFRDTVRIPRFPKADASLPRNNAFNESQMSQAKAMIESL